MDKKLQKLTYLRDGFWQIFTKTGSIYDYGKYKGCQQLINEHMAEIKNNNQMGLY